MSRAVGLASVLYGVTILLSRLLGLVREAVIGRSLGNGAEADAYWAAFVIPDFLNYALASGLMSLVFIPMFQRHLVHEDEGEAWASFSALFHVVLVLATLGTVGLWLAAPALAPWVAPGMDAAGQARVVELTRIVLPGQVFHILGGLLAATLQARDKHAWPAFAPLLYVGCVIAGGLLFADTLGAAGFAWGVLVGSALGPFGLPLIGALRNGLRWRLRLWHPDIHTWLVRSVPVMLGASVVVVDDWFVKHFASEVAEGAISRLQYGRTLMKVPMGVFGMAIGLAAFPTLSRLWAAGEVARTREALVRALRTLWVLAFAAAAALMVCGADVARVIWGTTRFTPGQLEEIGQLTALMCLALWAWSAQLLLARGFYAQGRTWPPTVVGTVVAVAALPLYGWLARAHGAAGLAVASSVAVSGYTVILAWALARSLGGGLIGPLADGLLRMTVAAGLGVAAGWGIEAALPAWPALLHGAVTGSVAGGVCLMAAWALRVPEVTTVVSRVRARLRR